MNENSERKVTTYSYDWSIALRVFGAIVVGMAVIVIGILKLYVDLFDLNQSIIVSIRRDIVVIIVGALICSLFSNIYPNIQLSKKGVYVQVFLFWWVFIGKESIVDIQDSFVTGPRVQIIFVRSLTPIHYLVGLLYRLTPKPAFRVARNIERYDELMKNLRLFKEIK